MAKRFDIHEWQAKQRLAEQEKFTPDLEDDDLKRSKIQQMMNTEKGLQKDDYKLVNSISNVAEMYSYGEILDALESFYTKNDEHPFAEMARKHAKEFRAMLDKEDEDEMFMGDWGPHLAENEENIPELSDEEKDNLTDMTNEFVRKLTDIRGGNYSGDKLLAALQFVILNVQDMEPMLYTDTDGDGTPDVVDNDEELDEVSTTGTGATFTPGKGEAFATPYMFGDNKRKKRKGYMGYKEVNEAHGLDKEDVNTLKSFLKTHLSKDKDPEVYKVLQFVIDSNIEVDQTKDLSKQTNEQEEEPEEKEYVKDVEKVADLPALDRVNTKAEWEDMMQLAFDMADDITQVQDAHKRMWLQNTLKSLNKA